MDKSIGSKFHALAPINTSLEKSKKNHKKERDQRNNGDEKEGCFVGYGGCGGGYGSIGHRGRRRRGRDSAAGVGLQHATA